MIQEIQEFERLLQRSCEPLRNAQVGYTSDERAQIAPWIVTVGGVVYINGEPKAYEADVDLRSIRTREDFHRLVLQFLQSFETAKKHKEA